MKWTTMSLLAIVLFMSMATLGYSQKRDIEIIKIKNADRAVDVSIANFNDIGYDVRVTINKEGMEMEHPLPSSIFVPAKMTIDVGKLIPISDKTRYKISCQASARDQATDDLYFDAADIVFYSKNNHEASTRLRNYLNKNEIYFREYNVSYSDKSKEKFEAMLKRRGIADKKVKLPVVIIKGEVFYNIENMKDFIKQHLTI